MHNGSIADWPDVVRDAGFPVKVWSNAHKIGHGPYKGVARLLWHHDASPEGPSPNVGQYLSSNWDNPNGSAGLWVDYNGVWNFISFWVMWHSGTVLPNESRFHYTRAAGVETDHTVGEGWPTVQHMSLRGGSAAILRHEYLSAADGLSFHKAVCSPVGRKVDPSGLDLYTERAAVNRLIVESGTSVVDTFGKETSMIIVTADGKFPAVLTGNVFMALNESEVASFTAAGVKIVKVRPEVWDGFAAYANRA